MSAWTTEQYQQYLKERSKSDKKKQTVVITDGYRSKVQGWREIGGKRIYFKSLYEINFANYLQWLKNSRNIIDWEYEPKTFPFPKEAYKAGPFYYKPDFLVKNNNKTEEWFEVKGWMNGSSKTKMKRFAKHYPNEKMTVIGVEWFQKNGRNFRKLIPGWETLPMQSRTS